MSRLPSVMKHNFSMVPRADIQRSAFNRSHGYKTTMDSGYLVPILVDEALPGDTFNLKFTAFGRLATPIVPVMDNLFFDTFFFAVPYRLVWDNWQKFNGEQANPNSSTDFLIPQMVAPAVTGYAANSLSDYFGIPTEVPLLSHSSLFHRAYNLIWNEWFRDQNMQNSVTVDLGNGPDSPSNYVLLKRGKRHDYFTSCLPWPQKGPAVTLPLGTSAPVYGTELGYSGGQVQNGHLWQSYTTSAGIQVGQLRALQAGTADGRTVVGPAASAADGQYISLGSKDQLDAVASYYEPPYADLEEATAATINALRQAFQLQRLYERDARGGTRYTEIIRAHFGVISPDARLQRPEYLGGGTSMINISPIAQTSASSPSESEDPTTPQANLAAIGTMTTHGNGFVKSFTEHCLIIGLANIRTDLNYQQGLNRMWSRRTRWDFYWPALAHIGEQAVLNKEIYAQGPAVLDDGEIVDDLAFGYQERYAEYRYKPSVITGEFRSNFAQSLDIWHLAQDFGSLPELNSTFIEENPPISRIIAVPTEPQFLLDCYFNYKCARPMPTYSVPGLIDHF